MPERISAGKERVRRKGWTWPGHLALACVAIDREKKLTGASELDQEPEATARAFELEPLDVSGRSYDVEFDAAVRIRHREL